MDGGPLIQNDRVRLRPVQAPTDLPFLQALWNDGRVMRYVGFPDGLGMTEGKMDRWWDRCQTWTATHLIIETLDGAPIGESGWGFMDQAGMLDIKLAPAYWGQAYAVRALEALLDYLWTWTTIPELIVEPHRKNQAARRLYQRLGFQPAPRPADLDPKHDLWTLSRPHAPLSPKTLIFDWGGVLMRTADDGGRRAWEARLALPAGGADRAVFQSEAWLDAQLGRCSSEQCWAAIGASLGLSPADLEQFRHDFWAGDRLDGTLIQKIRDWKAAGYQIALLSNYSLELELLLDQRQLRTLFDPIIISAHEGMMKPASRLYWRALARIGVPPAEGLFVDDFIANIAGARNVGLHAVHFRDRDQTITEIEESLS